MTRDDFPTPGSFAVGAAQHARQRAIRNRIAALPHDADLGSGILVLMALDAAGFDHEESMRLLEDVLGCARALRAADDTLVLG